MSARFTRAPIGAARRGAGEPRWRARTLSCCRTTAPSAAPYAQKCTAASSGSQKPQTGLVGGPAQTCCASRALTGCAIMRGRPACVARGLTLSAA